MHPLHLIGPLVRVVLASLVELGLQKPAILRVHSPRLSQASRCCPLSLKYLEKNNMSCRVGAHFPSKGAVSNQVGVRFVLIRVWFQDRLICRSRTSDYVEAFGFSLCPTACHDVHTEAEV